MINRGLEGREGYLSTDRKGVAKVVLTAPGKGDLKNVCRALIQFD
ncbi:MAG: hypothetical protein Ct9H90mP27_7370 [Gammaproteobacteria bacterium]|nr:MAG: hypothetical protein Ct9H90mP27_7370 [Gammaproteobacteria bacterium]